MAKKKDEPKQPTEQDLLEQKVDAMMDPKRPEADTENSGETRSKDGVNSTESDSELPPLDIFSGNAGAPEVPKELLEEVNDEKTVPEEEKKVPIDDEAENNGTPEETANDVPAEPHLDDDVSDAAVDEIVAEESDTVLAAEDAAAKAQAESEVPKKKAHRHPIFWTLITLLALLAALLAFLLVTGGNVKAPGIHGAQSLWQSLQKRL